MAELNFPNFADAYARGTAQGADRRNDRQQQDDRASLRGLAPSVIAGDPNALQAAAVINPEAAQQYQGVGDAQLRRLKGAIDYMDNAKKTGNMQAVEAAWRQVRPYLSQNSPAGMEPPETFAEAEPKMEEARVKIAMATQGGANTPVQSTRVGADGFYYTVDRMGNWTNSGVKADPKTQFRDQPGMAPGIVDLRAGTISPVTEVGSAPPVNDAPPMGAPRLGTVDDSDPVAARLMAFSQKLQQMGLTPEQQQALLTEFEGQQNVVSVPDNQPAQSGLAAARPLMTPAQEQQMQLSQQANTRAEEANQRAAQAAQQSQRGNAPAGFRFKPDDTLEPIPGGPKPAGTVATEGERKSATLLARLTGSLAQLEQAVAEDPSAASPNLLAAGVGSVLGGTAANAITPANRQRVEAAQLDILDAALTLGTGAAYTREQLEGYRKSYFPQIGDSPSTIADKQARLNNVIAAARIAAGRAAPAQQDASQRQIKRTGTLNGRKVVQYTDGTTEYAD